MVCIVATGVEVTAAAVLDGLWDHPPLGTCITGAGTLEAVSTGAGRGLGATDFPGAKENANGTDSLIHSVKRMSST